MRSLRALRGLRAVTSTALSEYAEVATRSLTTVPDLKSVLREKIPEQQVRLYCQGTTTGHTGLERMEFMH